MTDSSSLVSIVLPTYNGEKHLHRSIESCLGQSHQNVELIVIDDGSQDKTAEIIHAFNDQRIHYHRNEKNLGLVMSLNAGFRLTKGKYVTWTSDDNYYDDTAIEIMTRYLESESGVDFVYANYNVVDDQNQILRQGRVEEPKFLDQDNYVGACFLYRRKVYEALGDFNSEAFLAEDYEYWLRIREKFRMRKLNDILYYYRFHKKSLTAKYTEEKVQEQVEKIREKYIAPWKRHYFRGRKYFYAGQKTESKKELLCAIVLNPFEYETWRLLALLLLNPELVAKLKKLKSPVEK